MAEKKRTESLKYIIVFGIGGSNLGTMAITHALQSVFSLVYPRILFLDTVSAKSMQNILTLLDDVESADEILLTVVTKSGTTTEVMANFNVFYEELSSHLPQLHTRIVVITDYDSKLWHEAQQKRLDVLTVPKLVGGRYSVFSAVGLFPLLLAGFDIEKLREGARASVEESLSLDIIENKAAVSACLQFLHHKNGIGINNNFFFNPELESVGKWYRQLMGESIGKRFDIDGTEIHAGITPIVSIGSTDLHSMVQLYLGGPNDKFTTFVRAKNDLDVSVSEYPYFDLVAGIHERKLDEIMYAIYEGVKSAYKENKRPYMEILLHDVSEFTLGQYLQFKMIEMMYLGKLLQVNAFDQPNVEDYKKVTRALLEG